MAMDLLRDNPELRPFVLSNVTLTGTRIGAGAYGSVDEVAISVYGAAKKIHDIFQDRSEIPQDEIRRASTQFVKECRLMSTLRHPNIVQFLGVSFFEGSRLPALVMERLLTSLHDLLAPETRPPPGTPSPLLFFKLGLKCSVLHNLASGLDYLHHQDPPIIHRDLSARNILLNSRLVGKLADLGMARIVPRMRDAATMTKAPGASVYMPPEAIAPAESNDEKSKYDASIDVFSLGVVTIFTVGETFPCDPLAATYFNEEKGMVIGRTELQRRGRYMQNVNTQLRACGQLRGDHPLIRLIQQCLHNSARKRPNIGEVLGLLEEARAGIKDEESKRNRVELVRALQNQPRNQNLVQLIDDLVTENAELQQQLMRKEAELTRAEETVRREQQQIQEMRQQGTERDELLWVKDRELAQAQQQLRQLRQQEQSSRREIGDLQRQLQSSEAVVADLKTLQQRDSELETLRKTLQQRDSELKTLRTKAQSPLGPHFTRKDPLHDVIGHIKKNQLEEFMKLELKENEHLLELFRRRLQKSRVPSNWSPLVVAILNNTFETFKYVIENFKVNLEQETSAVIEGGYPVEGATPLWTASTLGLLKFVQILVERGAEIDHTTDSQSTPLRGAAFGGYYEVCKFLIERGADIDKPNEVGQSPLAIAAAMKKTDCVQLLIRKGANVNHRGYNGDTPLHVCVESGAVNVVEILVEAGAKNIPNEVGFTPSILACCYGHNEVMEFLDSRFKLDPKERYNCYCLLAAKEVFGSKKLKAEEWLTKAVAVRSQNSLQFADLPRADKIYDNLQEPTNRQEIDWILQDETSMFFVSAIFCERILGRIHPKTASYIRISGDMVLSEERWEKCIELWHRSLDFDHAARMAYELQIIEDLMFSTQGFCIMSKNDFRPPVEPHFRWGLKEFQLAHESQISQVEVMCCLSRMLAAWIQIMDKIEDKTQQLQEHEKINLAVKDLLKVSGSLKISLITACLQNLPDNASKNITNGKLPFHLVLSKLLDFECPLQCEDLAGNYPLHLAVQLKEDSALECVRTLIEYGCHVDAVNYNGETALDIAMRECGYKDLQSEIIAELKK